MKEKDRFYKVRNQLIDSGFFTEGELQIAMDIYVYEYGQDLYETVELLNKIIRARHNNFDNACDWEELFDEAYSQGMIDFDSRGVIK